MNRQLVVAWYNEQINWLTDARLTGWSKLVYDKGVTEFPYGIPRHKLPNVGREAHTYLHHLYHQYGNLYDLTMFTQGRWNDQVPDFMGIAYDMGPCDFYWLGVRDFTFNPASLTPAWLADPTREAWRMIFGGDPPDRVLTANIGAYFAASRARLHRFSQGLYGRLLEWVIKECEGKPQAPAKELPVTLVMERLWGIMYGEEDFRVERR